MPPAALYYGDNLKEKIFLKSGIVLQGSGHEDTRIEVGAEVTRHSAETRWLGMGRTGSWCSLGARPPWSTISWSGIRPAV